MAPSAMSFDYRSQIIDNCEFFIAKYDIVSVITARDSTGNFKAYAIRSNQDSRDVLLSSNLSNSVLNAIASLHSKSCEATHQYIATNGFAHPPDPKKTRFDEEEDDERVHDNDDAVSFVSNNSASSTVALSYWGSSDDEAAAVTPASSADPHAGCRRETTSISGGGNKKGNDNNTSKRRFSKPVGVAGGKLQPASQYPTEPYDSDDDNERQPHLQQQQQQQPSRVRLLSPVRSASSAANISTSYRPPPPPPGWTGPPMPPPPPVRAISIPTPQSQSQPGLQYYQHHPSSAGQQQQQHIPMPPPFPPTGFFHPIAPAVPPTVTNHSNPSLETLPPPPAPMPGPIRITPNHHTANTSALHYKASAPNLGVNNINRHSTSSLAAPPTTQHSPPTLNNTNNQTNHPYHPHPQRPYDIRLTIRCAGREQRVLETTRPSLRALQDTAVAYVRTHAAAFGLALPAEGTVLRAYVRNAFFGLGAVAGEAYDMSVYRGNDLGRLFGAGGGVPGFEVEVLVEDV